MLLISGVREDSWESLRLQGVQSVHPTGNQSWIFIESTDVEAETPIFGHLMWSADSFQKTWCWERLKVGGEGDNRGWDCWMPSLTQWTWVWVNSWSWWWTRRPSVLCFWGCRESDMAEQLNWTEYIALTYSFPSFQSVHCSISGSNCCFLFCIQVSQEIGKTNILE